MCDLDRDPCAEWYSTQMDEAEEENYQDDKWEFFTFSRDVGQTGDVEEQKIKPEDIDAWIDRLATNTPGVDLIFARHKDTGRKDIKVTLLPFRAARFRHIFKRLQLPSLYFYVRSVGATQCGAQSYHTERDDDGRITRMSFVIRPAHDSIRHYSSSWSFALTWNAQTGRTRGFLDGLTSGLPAELQAPLHWETPIDNGFKLYPSADIPDLKALINAASPLLAHPLTLPELLLHAIIVHLNLRIRVPSEKAFFFEERRTELSRVLPDPDEDRKHVPIWEWDLDAFKQTTNKANVFNTTLAYLSRRFEFAKQLTQRLIQVQEDMETYEFKNERIGDRVLKRPWARKERMQNQLALLENYAHNVESVGKRLQNLTTVLYTVLSQKEVTSQAQIAARSLELTEAVRSDGVPMRYIAYATLLLLPGAFIASIFGMNFFLFDPDARRIVVAKGFWAYWVITIPVTILVWVAIRYSVLQNVKATPEAENAQASTYATERDRRQQVRELQKRLLALGALGGQLRFRQPRGVRDEEDLGTTVVVEAVASSASLSKVG